MEISFGKFKVKFTDNAVISLLGILITIFIGK